MKHTAILKSKTILLALILFVSFCGSGISQTVDYNAMSKTELQAKIATLELGFDAYVVGRALTPEQVEIAAANPRESKIATVKNFKDGDLFVTVDIDSNVVIVLYKRNKKANKNDFKVMISDLMMQYGEPTAEAHGKTIYWNYGEEGLIDEELYRTVKSQGQLDSLIVLATVKFNSTENVETMTDMISMMDKKNEQGEKVKKADITSDNYVMIQSDMLSMRYKK